MHKARGQLLKWALNARTESPIQVKLLVSWSIYAAKNRIGQSNTNQGLFTVKIGHRHAVFTLWGNPPTSPCDPIPPFPFLLTWNLSPKDIKDLRIWIIDFSIMY